MSMHQTALNRCAYCHHLLDGALNVGGTTRPPRPGDVMFCVACAGLLIYADDGGVRLPTDNELLEVQRDPNVERARARAMAIIGRGGSQ
jgi:hypothetical protein